MRRLERIKAAKFTEEAEGFLELGMPHYALKSLARVGDPAGLGVEALYLWGESLRTMRRYYEALLPFERASRRAPDDLRIRLALGWCYKRTGRVDLAVGHLEKALALHPRNPLVTYNLACYLSLAGQTQRALRFLSRAMILDPVLRELVGDESDFDPIRAEPQFQAMCAAA